MTRLTPAILLVAACGSDPRVEPSGCRESIDQYFSGRAACGPGARLSIEPGVHEGKMIVCRCPPTADGGTEP